MIWKNYRHVAELQLYWFLYFQVLSSMACHMLHHIASCCFVSLNWRLPGSSLNDLHHQQRDLRGGNRVESNVDVACTRMHSARLISSSGHDFCLGMSEIDALPGSPRYIETSNLEISRNKIKTWNSRPVSPFCPFATPLVCEFQIIQVKKCDISWVICRVRSRGKLPLVDQCKVNMTQCRTRMIPYDSFFWIWNTDILLMF